MDEGHELEARVRALEEELAASRQEVEAAKRRHECQVELLKAGSIDLESAGVLVERALAGGGDVSQAVREVRERKPHLFRKVSAGASGGSQSAMSGTARTELDDAASAAVKGDRRALLEYMRLRRDRGR